MDYSSANDGYRLYLLARMSNHDILSHHDDCVQSWFVISKDEEDEKHLSPIPSMSRTWPSDTIFACLDSTIYVFGGNNYLTGNSSDFWLIDVANPSNTTITTHDDGSASHSGAWTKGRSMMLPRVGGCAVAIDWKIYVFGLVCQLPSYGPCSWAEIYDIDKGDWLPLEPPASAGAMPDVLACVYVDDLDVDFICAADDNYYYTQRKKEQVILVYFKMYEFLYAYYLKSGLWRVFDSHFGDSWKYLCAASGTNILLAIDRDWILYGYHLGHKEWFTGPIEVFKGKQLLPTKRMVVDHSCPFHFVSLGSSGKLCVLWTSRSYMLEPLVVTCTTFTVRESETSLVAVVESTKNFHLVDADALICCMPLLVPRRERKRKRDSNVEEEEDMK